MWKSNGPRSPHSQPGDCLQQHETERAQLRQTRRTRYRAYATNPDAEIRGGGLVGALIHHFPGAGREVASLAPAAALRGSLPALGDRRAAG